MGKHSYILAQFRSLAPHERLFSEFLCKGAKLMDKVISSLDVVGGNLYPNVRQARLDIGAKLLSHATVAGVEQPKRLADDLTRRRIQYRLHPIVDEFFQLGRERNIDSIDIAIMPGVLGKGIKLFETALPTRFLVADHVVLENSGVVVMRYAAADRLNGTPLINYVRRGDIDQGLV